MKRFIRPFSCMLTSLLVLQFTGSFAQCELKGDPETRKNWRAEYISYFSLDSSTAELIKADSVLIFYLSNPANETNYGMPCCYYLAGKYAALELKKNLKLLYKQLEKEDVLSFRQAQKAWQAYYRAESEFMKGALVGYSNFSKYGQGREIMIDKASRIYQLIKERIIAVKYYITITAPE